VKATALLDYPLTTVVGAGGVGKTTLAAALALESAHRGFDTLVMTFDPSLRLKDTLGVGDEARDREIEVPVRTRGRLFASLLDARATFDRLVRRYAPDERAVTRILQNRLYSHLRGTLAGVLEYMAVERLFEIAGEGRYDRVVLDTPPTRQAIDFLEAPDRIVGFLDSGALRIALRPWFAEDGHLRVAKRLGVVGRSVEGFFDRIVGLGLLRDMAEFFLAFGPLYDGFRERAEKVRALLRSPETAFVLVTRPEEERAPETLFFARRLVEAEHHLGAVIVNMRHPEVPPGPGRRASEGERLLAWLGERDTRGLETLLRLLPSHPVIDLPLLPDEPSDLETLDALRAVLVARAS
jgi:anion-transporting  ArsA/GET3 family ATPase